MGDIRHLLPRGYQASLAHQARIDMANAASNDPYPAHIPVERCPYCGAPVTDYRKHLMECMFSEHAMTRTK